MDVPRTRGAASGILLIALGIWGAIIPFVGPYFGYGFGPDDAFHFTWGHLWLNILPGAAAILGGLLLLAALDRVQGMTGAWLAIVAGTWFVIGPTISGFWNHGVSDAGAPIGTGSNLHIAEMIGIYLGLGAVVLYLASTALGRFTLRAEGDAALAARRRRAHEAAVVGTAGTAGTAVHDREPATVATTPAEPPTVVSGREPPA